MITILNRTFDSVMSCIFCTFFMSLFFQPAVNLPSTTDHHFNLLSFYSFLFLHVTNMKEYCLFKLILQFLQTMM